MAGPTPDLSALRALLATLGEDDYAALASRGLARRARNEVATARYAGWEEGAAVVAVGAHTVRVPAAGPARATCSCPAPGVCQHVIAACLALAAEAGKAPTGDVAVPGVAGAVVEEVRPAAAPWTAVDAAALRRWAGAAAWKAAVELAGSASVATASATGESPAPPAGATVVVTFADGVEARLPAGVPLDGLITNAPPRLRRRFLAAAVLAARRGEGWAVEVERAAAWQAPVELLAGVQAGLFELVRLGLHRATASTLGRLEVLGVRCRAAGAYRPAREIAACAAEIRWLLGRDARADPERLLDRQAALHALLEAVLRAADRPDPELVGSARTDYEERPALTLVGCGAWPWRTPSGFHGLTVLLWDGEGEQFVSWTDSRPVASGDGFDPAARFREEAPWAGAPDVERLARSAFRLERPRLSAQRRLSGSASGRVAAVAPAAAADLPPAEPSWAALRQRFAAAATLGLRRPVPLDLVVRLLPRSASRPRFDEIAQALVWPLVDERDEELAAVIPFAPENVAAIRWAESGRFASGDSLVGMYRPGLAESFFPVARIAPGERPAVESLAFVDLGEPPGWLQRLLGRRRDRSWSGPTAGLDLATGAAAPPGPLGQLLQPAREGLLAAAEVGLAARPSRDEWPALCDRLASAGLISLARALRGAFASPAALLRCAWLVALHAEAEGGAAGREPLA